MSILGEKIFELREVGLTYNQIAKELGCSKSSVTYYLNPDAKNKNLIRTRKNRKNIHPYFKKYENFLLVKNKNPRTQNQTMRQLLNQKLQDFFKTGKNMRSKATFSVQDLINKIGENPVCYLTGEPIDITKTRSYAFDHIIPRSRGGQNTLENLGICTAAVNKAKNDMTPDEFLNLCKLVIEHHESKTGAKGI